MGPAAALVAISALCMGTWAEEQCPAGNCTAPDRGFALLQTQPVPLSELVTLEAESDRAEELNEVTQSEMLAAGRALWAGSDAISEWYTRAFGTARPSTSPAAYEGVQILGMFDSGTNLLGATMKANIPNFTGLCPGAEDEGFHCFWDKHMLPSEARTRLASSNLYIAVVRSPVAHLAAWTKAPYDLEDCVDDYDKPCHLQDPEITVKGGVVEVWNTYTRGYGELNKDFDNVMLLEYERLVLEPRSMLEQIAKKLNVTMDDVSPFDAPAKDHGQALGRQAAIDKITKMQYLDKMSPGVRKHVCQQFSLELMIRHKIPTDPERSYADDCLDLFPKLEGHVK